MAFSLSPGFISRAHLHTAFVIVWEFCLREKSIWGSRLSRLSFFPKRASHFPVISHTVVVWVLEF